MLDGKTITIGFANGNATVILQSGDVSKLASVNNATMSAVIKQIFKLSAEMDTLEIPDVDMKDATKIVPYGGYEDWVASDTEWGFDGIYTPKKRQASAKPIPKTEAQLEAEKREAEVKKLKAEIKTLKAELKDIRAKKKDEAKNSLFGAEDVKTMREIEIEARLVALTEAIEGQVAS